MLKILTLIGARPQFIKAAALSRSIKSHFSKQIQEVIVHSGQHYDVNMSQIFFDELNLPEPAYIFDLTEKSHAAQTAEILIKLENVVNKEMPKAILVYGDTNTTLAGAILASKLNIHLIHIEAGLRSFNKSMPEEINRVLTDHSSSLLFCPTDSAIDNLRKESIIHHESFCSSDKPKVYKCGDIMYDNTLYFSDNADKYFLKKHQLKKNNFLLCTVHRAINTDIDSNLKSICSTLLEIVDTHNEIVVFPIHPRTKKAIQKIIGIEIPKRFLNHPSIKLIPPVSYLEMLSLEKFCSMILTDSGGVQKEAYFLKKPHLILREETEWVEIINSGTAKLVGVDSAKIIQAYLHYNSIQRLQFPSLFGDGNSAKYICEKLIRDLI